MLMLPCRGRMDPGGRRRVRGSHRGPWLQALGRHRTDNSPDRRRASPSEMDDATARPGYDRLR